MLRSGGAPPAAVYVAVTLPPETTLPSVEGPFNVSVAATMLSDRLADAIACEMLSLTVTLIPPLKVVEGVPPRLPEALMLSPAGKPLADHVYAPDPPLAMKTTGPYD